MGPTRSSGDRARQQWTGIDEPNDDAPSQTEATAVNSLGYYYAFPYIDRHNNTVSGAAVSADAVYHITQTIDSDSPTLKLIFAGNLTNSIQQNSWASITSRLPPI